MIFVVYRNSAHKLLTSEKLYDLLPPTVRTRHQRLQQRWYAYPQACSPNPNAWKAHTS